MAIGVGDEYFSTGLDATGVGVAVERGVGVALGTSKRPRRSDAVGDATADGDISGADVAAGVADLSGVITRRGVVAGVDAAVGAAVVVDIGVADVSAATVLVAAAAFTNFFDGAFGGGVASDFIF